MTDLTCGSAVWARIQGRNVAGIISNVRPADPDFVNVTVDKPVGKAQGPKMSYMVHRSVVVGR